MATLNLTFSDIILLFDQPDVVTSENGHDFCQAGARLTARRPNISKGRAHLGSNLLDRPYAYPDSRIFLQCGQNLRFHR
ncbi:hypothetical protein Q669_31810 [Labrenzia sp. C1B10]|nr:hypothetical protein Q669_31810 [Labrenzia sp. C1B10]ERS07422.1 hypothetical protein Q675_22780 [Labrenzia sp. C1B70]